MLEASLKHPAAVRVGGEVLDVTREEPHEGEPFRVYSFQESLNDLNVEWSNIVTDQRGQLILT